MARDYTSQQFEFLKMEVRDQFNWAREDGEAQPEGLAFIAMERTFSGHTRAGIKTAIVDAFHLLRESFTNAENWNPRLPAQIMMMTATDETGEPLPPSQELQDDLKRLAGHPVKIIVVTDESKKSLSLMIG